ncbi:MAG: transcription antitermination factor NusB [Alphaproteobacteria bacterium]|nr:transcription antitermination factor NusB [Alphaproteobacteria bacterium]
MIEKIDFDKKKIIGRRSARLAIVQALYQMNFTGKNAAYVINEFKNYRFVKSDQEDFYSQIDFDFFSFILKGNEISKKEIDSHIANILDKDWNLKRINQISYAILRAGAFEFLECPDIPTKVIISEYVDIAHDFFDDKEIGFVNGVLDNLAQMLRSKDTSKKKIH